MKVRLVESSHSVQTDAPVKSGHVAPEILKSFHDVHVRPGQPCNIEVVITGVPKPKVVWWCGWRGRVWWCGGEGIVWWCGGGKGCSGVVREG